MGRLRTIQTASQFFDLAETYFTECELRGEPVTLTGLTLALGLANVASIYDYRKRPEFADAVNWAMTHVEHRYERNLHYANATGSIFALKRFGWEDTHVNINHNRNAELTDEQLDARIRELHDRLGQ